MTTLYLVRHGEVFNPQGIIYGQLPGFGLSEKGRRQIEQAGELLMGCGPLEALYASPLQRAQESAAILAGYLALPVQTDERLVETGIDGYQGKPFSALPRPYITETATHPGIEAAASIRSRLLHWTEIVRARHPGRPLVAVSHRDPIGILLLHWQGRPLSELPALELATGGVHRVELAEQGVAVTRLG